MTGNESFVRSGERLERLCESRLDAVTLRVHALDEIRKVVPFDAHAWRSLLPITHSISLDVYDKETGLFMWNSDPAVEALEIIKRMMPLANPDVLQPGKTDGGVNQTPDEQVVALLQEAAMRRRTTAAGEGATRAEALPLSALNHDAHNNPVDHSHSV